MPAQRGKWSPPEQQAATLDCYERLFGYKVEQSWIRHYLQLIEEAKRRRLEQRANAAVRTKDAHATTFAEGQRLITAKELLAQVIEITNLAPEACRLPAYADDPELVEWLIARMGFEGGGGPTAMSSRRLKKAAPGSFRARRYHR